MAYKMSGPSLYPDFLKKKQVGPVETGETTKTSNVEAYKKSKELTIEEDDKLGFRKDQLKTDAMDSPDAHVKDKMSSVKHKGILAKHPSKKDGHTKSDHARMKAMRKFPYTHVERINKND